MSIRTEQTLRRMWIEASDNQVDAEKLMNAYNGHTSAAEEAERTARSHRAEAAKAKLASDEYAAQAADLTDMVNRERQDAGLAPLMLGEPYPPAPAIDTLVVSQESVTETVTDGLPEQDGAQR